MKLGEYITEYKKRHDLSQREFSKLCGLSNGYISMIEKGINTHSGKPLVPSITSVKKIASATGVPVQTLLDMLEDEPIAVVGELSPSETDLLQYFRNMDRKTQNAILQIAKKVSK